MAFEREEAEKELKDVLDRIQNVNELLTQDIIKYREFDTLVSEDDQLKTMGDIRFYLLRAYRQIDEILTDLDKYDSRDSSLF